MKQDDPHPNEDRRGQWPGDRPNPSDDGVDMTLIHWMLSLTPQERLRVLQQHVNAILKIRHANPDR